MRPNKQYVMENRDPIIDHAYCSDIPSKLIGLDDDRIVCTLAEPKARPSMSASPARVRIYLDLYSATAPHMGKAGHPVNIRGSGIQLGSARALARIVRGGGAIRVSGYASLIGALIQVQ